MLDSDRQWKDLSVSTDYKSTVVPGEHTPGGL
jgi:hypothetical protein